MADGAEDFRTPQTELVNRSPTVDSSEFAQHADLFLVKADSVVGGDERVTQLLHGFQLVDSGNNPVTENPNAPVHLNVGSQELDLVTGQSGSARITFPDKTTATLGPNQLSDIGRAYQPPGDTSKLPATVPQQGHSTDLRTLVPTGVLTVRG